MNVMGVGASCNRTSCKPLSGHQYKSNQTEVIPVADPGFSPGGAPTPKVGARTYFFGRKLHENERILAPRGARVPGAPLRSATAYGPEKA